jgi:hypothetical protein
MKFKSAEADWNTSFVTSPVRRRKAGVEKFGEHPPPPGVGWGKPFGCLTCRKWCLQIPHRKGVVPNSSKQRSYGGLFEALAWVLSLFLDIPNCSIVERVNMQVSYQDSKGVARIWGLTNKFAECFED